MVDGRRPRGGGLRSGHSRSRVRRATSALRACVDWRGADLHGAAGPVLGLRVAPHSRDCHPVGPPARRSWALRAQRSRGPCARHCGTPKPSHEIAFRFGRRLRRRCPARLGDVRRLACRALSPVALRRAADRPQAPSGRGPAAAAVRVRRAARHGARTRTLSHGESATGRALTFPPDRPGPVERVMGSPRPVTGFSDRAAEHRRRRGRSIP